MLVFKRGYLYQKAVCQVLHEHRFSVFGIFLKINGMERKLQ